MGERGWMSSNQPRIQFRMGTVERGCMRNNQPITANQRFVRLNRRKSNSRRRLLGVDTREKTNRESARIRPTGEKIGFAYPHLNSAVLVANQRFAQLRVSFSAHPARPAGSSLIGSVRANPVAAPAAPLRGIWDILIFQVFFISIN